MTRLTGGQAVVRCLEDRGVEIVFGMPGINILHIYDALLDSSIRHIVVRHEQSAAFMADGYARATGKLGVCLTTAGPGLTNAVTGLAAAYSDSIPVLILAGEISSALIGKEKGALHEIDQTSIARPITKEANCVFDSAKIPNVIQQALEDLESGRPRPIYVGLPEDLLEVAENFRLRQGEVRVKKAPRADSKSVEAAANLLSQSRHPVILAGGGVTRAEASSELIQIAELLSAPVVTTVNGAGSIPVDHPLFLGRSRMTGVVDQVFRKADTILAIGTRFSSMSMSHWTLKVPRNLIHVDIDSEVIGRNYPAKVSIRGDAKLVLQQITHRVRSMPRPDRSDWMKTAQKLKDSGWRELEASHPTEVGTVTSIRRALKRDAIVAADTTILSYWMQRIFPVYEPRTFLYPSGYVAMGYALPAAIASKIAFPGRQVIAVCGDGGFMVTCQELMTAVENKVCVPIVLHNNGGFGILRHFQEEHFKQRYIGVDLKNPDFIRLAESFGAEGVTLKSLDQMEPSLREALQASGPTVIEVQMPLAPPS